jgi:hypothetical protein
MLPLPPVIAWTLAAVGATALARVLVKEWRRVNAELDAQELQAQELNAQGRAGHERAAEPAREQRPTLRRDPRTGVYRPE